MLQHQDMAKVVCSCKCTVNCAIPLSDVPCGDFALAPPSSSPVPPTCSGILEVFVIHDVSHPVEGIVGLRTDFDTTSIAEGVLKELEGTSTYLHE